MKRVFAWNSAESRESHELTAAVIATIEAAGAAASALARRGEPLAEAASHLAERLSAYLDGRESDALDYRELLRKYVARVGEVDGTALARAINSNAVGSSVEFTSAEVAELRRMAESGPDLPSAADPG